MLGGAQRDLADLPSGAGVLASVMEQPEAREALEQGWAPGAAVVAIRIAF